MIIAPPGLYLEVTAPRQNDVGVRVRDAELVAHEELAAALRNQGEEEEFGRW